jgi:hypothetical protein
LKSLPRLMLHSIEAYIDKVVSPRSTEAISPHPPPHPYTPHLPTTYYLTKFRDIAPFHTVIKW